MAASPSSASLHSVQRARETLWVQTRRKVPASSSRATNGAPQKIPMSPGTTMTTPDSQWLRASYLAVKVLRAAAQSCEPVHVLRMPW